jgi:signal transduction histidine kinase
VVSITDDGPGIPAHQHEQVFKRFYRLEQSRYTPGNGLGLSLVAAVARLHGARIEMSDRAPGLQFKLWFSAPGTPQIAFRADGQGHWPKSNLGSD